MPSDTVSCIYHIVFNPADDLPQYKERIARVCFFNGIAMQFEESSANNCLYLDS